jgi:hypothetical protein
MKISVGVAEDADLIDQIPVIGCLKSAKQDAG